VVVLAKVASEPETLIGWFRNLGFAVTRIGLKAGLLSQWLYSFAELEASDETAALAHADWLGLLLDRELTYRHDKRPAARLNITCYHCRRSGTYGCLRPIAKR
jgi:hypothetical protein